MTDPLDSRAGLPTGKLPPDLLRSLVLGRLGARRPETIVRAQLGVDAAALALNGGPDGGAGRGRNDDGGGEELCVLTTDPITTAAAGAGRLAVHVVCNDLAAMGAEPIGLLATLLFPAGTFPHTIAELTADIDAAAKRLNVEVLGGHTEIAPNVNAPLVVMCGVGRARRDRLLTAAGARPGDAVVLTKAAALEGTHILAADLAPRLGNVPTPLLELAASYAEELSVVPEALAAVGLGATAMHDPTEGGVVGALWEMAEASGCGFRISVSKMTVREPTRAICRELGLDPLRLIASGALLIACQDAGRLLRGLQEKGIEAAEIGAMTPLEAGRTLVHPDGREEPATAVTRDELYRILEQFSA